MDLFIHHTSCSLYEMLEDIWHPGAWTPVLPAERKQRRKDQTTRRHLGWARDGRRGGSFFACLSNCLLSITGPWIDDNEDKNPPFCRHPSVQPLANNGQVVGCFQVEKKERKKERKKGAV